MTGGAADERMSQQLLFGGSFDPIHHGHLIVSRYAAEALGIERIVLIPAASPPHKPGVVLARGEDRFEMCRVAVEGDDLFDVSDCELHRSGPSYSIVTVEEFRRRLGDAVRLYWLIGVDSLIELHTWHRAAELVDLCTFVTVARAGFDARTVEAGLNHFSSEQANALRANILASPCIEISATEIRDRVRSGLSIRHLVPARVREFIAAHRLYQAAT